MADFWFAECIPCQWQQMYTAQDYAIRAAEDHVIEFHRDVPSAVRGKEYIGHVQNRTENAIGMLQTSGLQVPMAESETPETSNSPALDSWDFSLAPTKPA